MADTTTNYSWAIPLEYSDPWYTAFLSLANSIDASLLAVDIWTRATTTMHPKTSGDSIEARHAAGVPTIAGSRTGNIAGNEITRFEFAGEDSASHRDVYAAVASESGTLTSGAEQGSLHWYAKISGALTEFMTFNDGANGDLVVSADILATKFDTNVAAAGVTLSGTTLSADGTDGAIDITISPKGFAGIVLPNIGTAPADTSHKLYSLSGVLYFDGVSLEGSGASTLLSLTDTMGTFTTANALYRVNAAGNAMAETTLTYSEPAANQFALTRGTAALTVSLSSTIDQNLASTASPTFVTLTTTSSLSTTFDTNVAAAGVTLSGTTLSADGSDTNIGLSLLVKGNAGITLTSSSSAPALTTNKLYNLNGVLYFDTVSLEAVQGATQLSELSDVSSSTASNGRILISDAIDFSSQAISGAMTLSDAGVTAFTATANAEAVVDADLMLIYNISTAQYERTTRSAFISGGVSYQLSDLTDVGVTTVGAGRLLVSGAASWESQVIDGAISIDGNGATAIVSTAETVTDDDDLILIYDDSASAYRRQTRANFLSGLELVYTTWSGTSTNATPTEIFIGGISPTRQDMTADQTDAYLLVVIARDSTLNASKVWHLTCAAQRDSANNSALVDSVNKEIIAQTDTPGGGSGTDLWDVDATVNDTDETFRITVTGAAVTTITWSVTSQ